MFTAGRESVMVKVTLPDGTVIENMELDPRIHTVLKLFPLGSTLVTPSGRKYTYCYKEVSKKTVKGGT